MVAIWTLEAFLLSVGMMLLSALHSLFAYEPNFTLHGALLL
jgi:hypothetical protein